MKRTLLFTALLPCFLAFASHSALAADSAAAKTSSPFIVEAHTAPQKPEDPRADPAALLTQDPTRPPRMADLTPPPVSVGPSALPAPRLVVGVRCPWRASGSRARPQSGVFSFVSLFRRVLPWVVLLRDSLSIPYALRSKATLPTAPLLSSLPTNWKSSLAT